MLHAEASPIKQYGYTVTVEIKVNEKGETESVSLINSDANDAGNVIEKMALAMAMKTKIPPQIKDGKPVRASVHAPFFFPIDDDEGPAAALLPQPRPKREAAIMPVYPPEFRDSGVVGGAILEIKVDAQGKLTSVRSLRASHPAFEKAATDAINRWQFAPAMKDGHAVESRTRIAFVFETQQDMADIKWRIPPRPALGSFVVIRPNEPIQDEPPAADGKEAPAAPASPAAETPAQPQPQK
jgi:TonB family protein